MHHSVIIPQEQIKENILREFGPGEITIRECPACGHFEFVMARKNKPDNVVFVTATKMDGCKKCAEIIRRNPEVYEWVLNVVTKSQKDGKVDGPST